MSSYVWSPKSLEGLRFYDCMTLVFNMQGMTLNNGSRWAQLLKIVYVTITEAAKGETRVPVCFAVYCAFAEEIVKGVNFYLIEMLTLEKFPLKKCFSRKEEILFLTLVTR